MWIMITFVWLVSFFLMLFLLFKIVKQTILKQKSLFKSYSHWGSKVAPNIIFVIFLIIYVFIIFDFRIMIVRYLENYQMMQNNYGNEYLTGVSDLFNLSKLNELKAFFFEKEEYIKSFDISTYLQSIHGLIVYIHFAIIGFIGMLGILNTRYETINDMGVLYKNWFFKWEEISSYSWSDLKKTYNGVEYHELIFILKDEKRGLNKLFNRNREKFSMKIDTSCYDEVKEFLKEKRR